MQNHEKQNMKLYPIAENLDWVQKLVSWGAKTIQLRMKCNDSNSSVTLIKIENEIKNAIEFCHSQHCQLFINDYWEIALKYNAFGIHLGYEDSFFADITAIQNAKIKFGLSTHNEIELSHALKLNPTYIALGPIFPTQTKIMKFSPQGLNKISEWRKKIPTSIPLVAIGGIKLENAIKIYQSGADSISIIQDYMKADNPEERIKSWLKLESDYEFT